MEKMFCKYCGKEINASAGFCPFCGNSTTVSENVNKSDNTIKQEIPNNIKPTAEVKPLDTASLVLGIATIVFAVLMPTISIMCGIIGIVLSINRRKNKRTKLAFILCLVGILLSCFFVSVVVPSMLNSLKSQG